MFVDARVTSPRMLSLPTSPRPLPPKYISSLKDLRYIVKHNINISKLDYTYTRLMKLIFYIQERDELTIIIKAKGDRPASVIALRTLLVPLIDRVTEVWARDKVLYKARMIRLSNVKEDELAYDRRMALHQPVPPTPPVEVVPDPHTLFSNNQVMELCHRGAEYWPETNDHTDLIRELIEGTLTPKQLETNLAMSPSELFRLFCFVGRHRQETVTTNAKGDVLMDTLVVPLFKRLQIAMLEPGFDPAKAQYIKNILLSKECIAAIYTPVPAPMPTPEAVVANSPSDKKLNVDPEEITRYLKANDQIPPQYKKYVISVLGGLVLLFGPSKPIISVQIDLEALPSVALMITAAVIMAMAAQRLRLPSVISPW